MPNLSNLDVAVSSFWQLARHWNQDDKAKLELSCEGGTLQLQLSAVLGHQERPHFLHPPSSHPPPPVHPPPPSVQPKQKNKSPSKIRRQERWHIEASKSNKEDGILKEASKKDNPNSETSDDEGTKDISDSPNVMTAEMAAPVESYFNCDQCSFKDVSKNEVKQHTIVTHIIPQLDGHSGLEDEDSNFEWSLCPLCFNEDNYFASEKGLCTHIMNYHEPGDVFPTFGKEWVSEQMQYTKKNLLRKWEIFLDQECQCKECKEKQSHKHIECGWSQWP
jgi:hypothetical protein